MSDVTVAPNAAPPPTPSSAPAANEVVINPNPTASPQPVGSQAPEKPVGDVKGSEHRPTSRREAIQKAFERANTPERKEATKPKQAKMGDNNPPEETPKLDLKKRPEREPQPREQGRFVARTPEGEEYREGAQQQAANQQAAQQQRPAQLPEGSPFRDAPQRMTERAKADWHGTPESVRADVHRMHQEFDGAYRRYRGDHETMNTIRPFHQMAQEHGTTLERALTNYTTMEHKLRTDVIGGLDIIVQNLNLRTPDGRQLTLIDVAHHILSRTPDQHKLQQSQNLQMAQSHQLQQTNQRLAGLENMLQRMQTAETFRHTRGAVDQFADGGQHPRFDELSDLIEGEIKLGFDLETAYRRAELLRPATQAAQTRNSNGTAAQTRTSDRSIHGAPDGAPSNGAAKRANGSKPVGRREAIANAIKRVNNTL